MPPPVQVGQALRYYQKWAFLVEIETVIVAGFTKAGPLKQTMGIVEQHEGGKRTVVDISVSKYKTEKVSLERGGSENIEMWNWWLNQKTGVEDKRVISILGQINGVTTTRWNFSKCVLNEFQAAEFDAKNETENIIEMVQFTPLDMDRTTGP